MAEAGHKEEFRDMVTTRVGAKYCNSLRNNHREMQGSEGGKVMYRTKREKEEQWRREGGKPTKANWFLKAGFTSVLYVPATKGSVTG